MKSPRLSIVLPCYNEADNLPFIVSRLRDVIGLRNDIEVILVNNGSKDATAETLAKELADPALSFIRIECVDVNQGYGFGIMSGLRAARGEFLGWTHADMQTDPADVLQGFEKLLACANPGRAFLKGCRIARNPLDAFFTFGMSVISSACLGIWLHDINAQPKIFSRRFYEMLKSPPDDFSLDLYVCYLARKSSFEFLTQPVDFGKRLRGEAKGGGTLLGKMKLIQRTLRYVLELRRDIRAGRR